MRTGNLGLASAVFGIALFAQVLVSAEEFRDFSKWDPNSEVDVELVLAVDISQSMDDDEQEAQRQGYIDAITSSEVMHAIKSGPTGRIALTYMEWSGAEQQYVVVPWMTVSDAETAGIFAQKLRESPYRNNQRTSISKALLRAAELIEGNTFQGLRRVIDISGDGPNNQGGSVTEVRDSLVERGIVINGLPLRMKPPKTMSIDLEEFYERCVTGGIGHFQITVRSKDQFKSAIKAKLIMEIADLGPRLPLVQKAGGKLNWDCDTFD